MLIRRPPELHHIQKEAAIKAIRVHQPAAIGGLVFEEAPDAKPFFCDVLVKVAACGITHNELDYPVWTRRAGHQRTLIISSAEMSGVVTALGLGDRRDRRKRRAIRADRPVA